MHDEMRDLASALATTPGSIRKRQGTIVSVAADGTATITIGGSDVQVPGVAVTSSCCPVPGAACWLMTDGVDVIVTETLAPTGPAYARMRASAVQTIGSGAFTAMDWTSRSVISDKLGMCGNGGLTIIVPGIYTVSSTPAFLGNAAGSRHSQVIVNGASVGGGTSAAAPGTGIARLGANVVTALAIGDVVNVSIYQNSGGDLNTYVGAGYCTLAAAWLGPAQ